MPPPRLTGTVTDPAASMTVRVNGSYYAATNNGDGTWSLPQADIATLGPGTYNVVAVGVNTSGVAAFDLSTNQLIIATAPPTVTLQSLPAPTLSPISSLGHHLQRAGPELHAPGPAVHAHHRRHDRQLAPGRHDPHHHQQPELDAGQSQRADGRVGHLQPDRQPRRRVSPMSAATSSPPPPATPGASVR